MDGIVLIEDFLDSRESGNDGESELGMTVV